MKPHGFALDHDGKGQTHGTILNTLIINIQT